MMSFRKLEKIAKGTASHRRLQILDLLEREPELSVTEISIKIKSDLKNVSEHIRKLSIAGLIIKRNQGKTIRHKLTDRGSMILTFYRTLE